MRGEIFLIDLEIFDFLTVSVMCDGNNSLWSGSELGVQNQNGHDDHQSYHSSSKAVNNQGFGNKVRHGREDFIFDFFSSWSQSLGAIIVGVHEERHPVEVGQTKGSAKVGNSVIIKIRQKLSKKARQHTQNYTLCFSNFVLSKNFNSSTVCNEDE